MAWKRLMDNKNKELDRLNGVYMKILDGAGVAYHEGRGKIIDAHTIDVDGKRFTVCPCVLSAALCMQPDTACALLTMSQARARGAGKIITPWAASASRCAAQAQA